MTRARDVADTQDNTGGAVAPFLAGKNKIINGDFGIWQRGTSFTTGNTAYVYTADRWLTYFYGSNTSSVTQQTFTAGTAPVAGYEGQFFGRFNSTSTANFFSYRIEDVRTLAGQTATLSFWAKSNSNQTITATVSQNFGSGGSATVASVISGSPALTTSWQRFSYTATIPSISGKTIGTSSYVLLEWVGAANNAIDIWGVQLEAGNVATPFTTATGTLAGELAACCRYYYLLASGNNKPIGTGIAYDGSRTFCQVYFPTVMRYAPTLECATGTDWYSFQRESATDGFNSFVNYLSSTTGALIENNGGLVNPASGRGGMFNTANASALLAFNAEL